MVHRIPSTLMRSIDPVSGELTYVDRPGFFEEVQHTWQNAGVLGRIGLSIALVCLSPLLALGWIFSLLSFAIEMVC
jgi:hypothetical protein